MNTHHLKLASSEQALLNASATIFSAFVAAGRCPEDQEKEIALKAANLAILIAKQIDRIVIADDEVG